MSKKPSAAALAAERLAALEVVVATLQPQIDALWDSLNVANAEKAEASARFAAAEQAMADWRAQVRK
jgi:hypothetical protein